MICTAFAFSFSEGRAYYSFTQATDTDWFNPANWSSGFVPTSTDDAWAGYGVTAVIDGDASASNVQVYAGASITVDDALFSADSLFVGSYGDLATFTVQNGAQATIASSLNVGLFGQGSLIVTGSGSALTLTGNELVVGNGGSGSVTISDGAQMTVGSSRVGMSSGDTGSLLVTGANSSLTITNSLYLGYGGQGTLTVANGATGSSGDMTFNYYQPGASGTMTVTGAGSQWTANGGVSIFDGSLTVAEGGAFTATGAIYIGTDATLYFGTGGLGGAITTPYLSIDGSMIADFTDNRTLSTILLYGGTITKKGSGTLTLTADNSNYYGTITVLAGTLRATTFDSSLGTGSAQLVLNGGNLTLANDTGLSPGVATTISAATVITSDRLTSGAGVTHTLGTLSISGQTLFVAAGTNVASGTAGITFGSTSLTAVGTAFDTGANTLLTLGSIGGAYAFEKKGAGQLTLGNASTRTTTAGSTTLTAGTLRLTAANALNTNSAAALYLNGGTLQLANNTATVFNGTATTLGGDATISVDRTSSGAARTYTIGALTLGVYTLAVAQGANFSANTAGSLTAGATKLTGDATLNLTNVNGTGIGVTTLGALNDSGTARTLTKNGAGTLTLATAATSLVNGTSVNLQAGTLNLNNAAALGSLANVRLSSGATLALGSSTAPTLGALNGTGGSVTLGSNTLTVGNGANNLTSSFGGVIGGTNGKLIKAGTGTLTLSGANTYTGATSVNAGTLFVNGSLANTAVSVASGATIGGSGTFAGLASIANGGHLAPGNSVGTITFTGGLTLNAGAALDLQLGTTSDLLRVSGGTLTGTSTGLITVNLSDSGGFTAGTYTLLDATGATLTSIGATTFDLGTTIDGYTYNFSKTGNLIQLTANAIPEPATYAALFGAAALALAAWRRRRARLIG